MATTVTEIIQTSDLHSPEAFGKAVAVAWEAGYEQAYTEFNLMIQAVPS